MGSRYAYAINVRYEGTDYLPRRRTLSRVQLGETIFTRTSVLGRLVAFAAIGGVLAAAMVIPVVAATGVLVRNEANKFTTLSLSARGLPQRSEILDRYGNFLAYVYGVDVSYYESATHAGQLKYFGWDRQPVSYDQIAPNMVNAVVAIEDSRYWEHGAIDLRGTIRAAMNDAYYGNFAYGIEAAAETYFGTSAAKLSVTQAATLAGIVENPSNYDPVRHPGVVLERRNTVLARM